MGQLEPHLQPPFSAPADAAPPSNPPSACLQQRAKTKYRVVTHQCCSLTDMDTKSFLACCLPADAYMSHECRLHDVSVHHKHVFTISGCKHCSVPKHSTTPHHLLFLILVPNSKCGHYFRKLHMLATSFAHLSKPE
jgi:hypothetical protein